eukprot:7388607-Prymnesium_polylepis.1
MLEPQMLKGLQLSPEAFEPEVLSILRKLISAESKDRADAVDELCALTPISKLEQHVAEICNMIGEIPESDGGESVHDAAKKAFGAFIRLQGSSALSDVSWKNSADQRRRCVLLTCTCTWNVPKARPHLTTHRVAQVRVDVLGLLSLLEPTTLVQFSVEVVNLVETDVDVEVRIQALKTTEGLPYSLFFANEKAVQSASTDAVSGWGAAGAGGGRGCGDARA